MEPLKNVMAGLAAGKVSGEEVAARTQIARLKRMAHDGDEYKSKAALPIEALFFYAASSLYNNDSRNDEIRRMEMQRLEIAYQAAVKQLDALRKMIRVDNWKEKATEEARTKIRQKKAGKNVPESWEELAMLLAGILDNDPATREDPA